MNPEKPQQTKKESVPNPDVESVQSPKEIERYFAFADPVLGVDWGEDGVLEDYTPEYIAAHPELTQIFVARDGNGEIIGGAKVKMLDEEEKLRLGLNSEAFEGQTGALLEYTVVKEEYRNNRLLADLTEKRIEWAKEHQASYVSAEAEITNPISVYTKIRDGFVLVSVQEPIEGVIPDPYFVEIKTLRSTEHKERALPIEWKEVTVTENSFNELRGLFADGWIGIDIKGATDAPEKLSIPWTLIMEKRLID